MLSLFNSVKRSDLTGNRFEWELGQKRLCETRPPYFIVLASSVKTKEVKAIEFHRIKLELFNKMCILFQTKLSKSQTVNFRGDSRGGPHYTSRQSLTSDVNPHIIGFQISDKT